MVACPICTFNNSELLHECEMCASSLEVKATPKISHPPQPKQAQVEHVNKPHKVNKAKQTHNLEKKQQVKANATAFQPSINKIAKASSAPAPTGEKTKIFVPVSTLPSNTTVVGKVCGCFCTRHELLGNCTTCGIPVCKEEEWMFTDGCHFCKTFMYSNTNRNHF